MKEYCGFCKKAFAEIFELNIYGPAVHEGKKPHGCGICEESFTKFFKLNNHTCFAHFDKN